VEEKLEVLQEARDLLRIAHTKRWRGVRALQAVGKNPDIAGSVSADTLDSPTHLPQHSVCCTGQAAWVIRPGFAGIDVRSCGRDDAQQTRTRCPQIHLGEENDATWKQTLISLDGEVTAQV
jgi:hypothetical protein